MYQTNVSFSFILIDNQPKYNNKYNHNLKITSTMLQSVFGRIVSGGILKVDELIERGPTPQKKKTKGNFVR